MTNRNRLVPVLIAVNLIVIAVAVWIVFSQTQSSDEAFLLQRSGQITSFVLSGGRGSRTLLTSPDGWRLQRSDELFPVRDDRISLLLSVIREARVDRIVTDNPARWSSFGVDENQRSITVTGRDQYQFFVGSGPEERTYVRFADSDRVVETKAPLRLFLDQPDEFWMPLRVFPADLRSDDIIVLSIRPVDSNLSDLPEIELFQSGGNRSSVWRNNLSGADVDADSAEGIVYTLSDLLAETLVTEHEASTGELVILIGLQTANGESWQVPVRLDGDYVYLDGPGSDPPVTEEFWQVVRLEDFAALLESVSRL
jgi:hypothetical protein